VVTPTSITTKSTMRKYLVEVNLMACLQPPSNDLKPDFPREEGAQVLHGRILTQ
jgi:hypothetical protein